MDIEGKTLFEKLQMAAELARIAADTAPIDAETLHTLTRMAKEILPARVEALASRMHVTYGRVTIRHQKTRWGSCSSKGNLNFNCLLLLAPPTVVDSVVIHELCHLKHMNHSAQFYAELSKYDPHAQKSRRWLRENGVQLIQRMMMGEKYAS